MVVGRAEEAMEAAAMEGEARVAEVKVEEVAVGLRTVGGNEGQGRAFQVKAARHRSRRLGAEALPKDRRRRRAGGRLARCGGSYSIVDSEPPEGGRRERRLPISVVQGGRTRLGGAAEHSPLLR